MILFYKFPSILIIYILKSPRTISQCGVSHCLPFTIPPSWGGVEYSMNSLKTFVFWRLFSKHYFKWRHHRWRGVIFDIAPITMLKGVARILQNKRFDCSAEHINVFFFRPMCSAKNIHVFFSSFPRWFFFEWSMICDLICSAKTVYCSAMYVAILSSFFFRAWLKLNHEIAVHIFVSTN